MNGSAQRPLAVCTIRETYWNKAGTESPAVGGFIWRAAGHWLNFDQHSCSTSPFSVSQPQTGQWTLPPTGGDPGILATGPSLTPTPSCVLQRGALSFTSLSLFHLPWNTNIWLVFNDYFPILLMVGVVFGKAGSWTLDPGLFVFDTNQRKSAQWT